jgi:HD-GYP domain-containing protein (c-di-GMP phosphodiesterase class II)/serine/threonine protein kinase/tetratricopeptide (TPR) repeat protein
MANNVVPSTDLPPYLSHRYSLVQLVHSGMYTRVYQVQDRVFPERSLALKILGPSADSYTQSSFKTVFLGMAKCSHPGVLQVFDYGIDPDSGSVYCTSEWIDHCPFPTGPWDPLLLLETVKNLCSTLSYLHRLEYLISDLTESNLLLSRDGKTVKLLNCGFPSDTGGMGFVARKRSISCLAPELIQGEAADYRVDLYALGVFLYEAATGKKLFKGSVGQILKQHLSSEPPDTDIDPDLQKVIKTLLAKHPDQRYQSAEDVILELKHSRKAGIPWVGNTSDWERPESRFTGRQNELKHLETVWSHVSRNSAGKCLLLEGQEGIGKKSLLRHFSADIKRHGVLVMHCRSPGEFDRSLTMIDQYFSRISSTDDSVRSDSPAETMLSKTASHPCLFIIDDLHRSGADELERLEEIIQLIQTCPVMICCTCCPELIPYSTRDLFVRLKSLDQILPLRILPLTVEECKTYLESYFGTLDFQNEIVERLHSLTGGNALFISETLGLWINQNGLEKIDGRWMFFPDRISPRTLSDRQSEAIDTVLEALSIEARKLVGFLAVFHRDIDLDLLSLIFSADNLESLIRELVDYSILKVVPVEKVDHYCFVYDVLPSVIYQTISLDIKTGYHERIAEVLSGMNGDPEDIAYHQIRGKGKYFALDAILRAAEHCSDQGAFNRASYWINEAASELDDQPLLTRAAYYSLRSHLSLLHHRSEDVFLCKDMGLQMYPEGPEHAEKRASFWQFTGRVYFRKCQFLEAIEEFNSGLKELGDKPSKTTVSLHIMLQKTYLLLGQMDMAEQQIRRAEKCLEFLSEEETAFARALVISAWGDLEFHQGNLSGCEARFKETLEMSESEDLHFLRIYCRNKLGQLYIETGNFSDAERLLKEALGLCDPAGLAPEKAISNRLLADLSIHQANYTQAETYNEQALTISQRADRKIEVVQCRANKAWLERVFGKLKEAENCLADILNIVQRIQCPYLEADILTQTGLLKIDQAEYSKAVKCFQTSLKINRKSGRIIKNGLTMISLANVYFILNNRKRARYYLRKTAGWVKITGALLLVADCHYLRSRVDRYERRSSQADTQLELAGKQYESIGFPNGILSVNISRLRMIIDHELSHTVWRNAVKLWENLRNQSSILSKLEGGLVVAKLAMRRGDYENTRRILDALVGTSREQGYREILWRALRIQGQAMEERGLFSGAKDSYQEAWKTLQTIRKDIHSELMRKWYFSRPDIESISSSLAEIRRQHFKRYAKKSPLPSISESSGTVEKSQIALLGERYRLMQTSSRKIRTSLDIEQISTHFLDAALKLTGSDRGVVYLIDESETLQVMGSKTVGAALPIDTNLLLKSELVMKVLNNRHFIFSSNIQIDERFEEDPFAQKLGIRPILCMPLQTHERLIGLIYIDTRLGNAGYLESAVNLIDELAEEAALSIENARLYTDLDDIFMGMVRALSSAVDAKDPYTHGHSSRVSKFAVKIGQAMNFSSEELRELELAAILHDIGKIGISQVILNRPTHLLPSEMEMVQHHPEIGAKILSPLKKFRKVWTAVLQHHERFDGTGYPHQLAGEDIHLYARIISAADALDAMTTDRPYQKGISFEGAALQFQKHAGSQFDPHVADVVNKLIQKSILP